MAQRTRIQWTDATFNPWWGCERVSPACAHCYADTLARRYGHSLWGGDSPRRFLSEQHWRQPIRWNTQAAERGEPTKVFCASMADVFEDRAELEPWRDRLWTLIDQTPMLHWQLLTKRPENVVRMVPWPTDDWPPNVWVGTSVENSRHTFRVEILRELPAAIRFVSAEPLLGSLFLNGKPNRQPLDLAGVDWVIAGGESGPRFRAVDLDWVRELRDACVAAGVPFFYKQRGGRTSKSGGRELDGRIWGEFPAVAERV
ncbi:MAG: phage Gp37/Gp68 family protein [Gaiellaceae bacterium]